MSNEAEYSLHYWGGIPGRGEFIRLAFEATGTAYKDTKAPATLLSKVQTTNHPPHLAPPILEIGQGTFISQTSNILNYLAPKLGLDGVEDGTAEEAAAIRRAHVNQLVLTALDLNNEAHDVHHPIASRLYYEDQQTESVRRGHELRNFRLPKFLTYFSLVLRANDDCDGSQGWKHLIGNKLTTADLVLFHVVSGFEFAFPRRMATLRKDEAYKELFAHRDGIAALEPIAAYLSSQRRLPFSMGIFRHYPELDGE